MKKPTITLLLDTRRKKQDDRYPVKLRITHERKQRYWYTGIDLTEAAFEEVMVDRPKKQFVKVSDELKAKKRKAENIIHDLKEFSFHQFELKYLGAAKSIQDVFSFYEEYITELKKDKRVGTASSYQCSLNSLKAFRKSLGFKEVDPKFLRDYEKNMISNGNSITTVGIYLRCLRTMFNRAINEGLLGKEHYPFLKQKYIIPSARNVKKALSLEEVKKIFDCPVIPGTAIDFAKDIWMFSYMSNGMNIKDIALLKTKDVNGEYLRFVRAKTVRSTRSAITPISVYLVEAAQEIVSKYKREDAQPDDYLFPILQHGLTAEKEMKVIQQAVKQVNKYVKRIAKETGIDKEVTTYFARHSFATVLKKSGASMEYISEALGHQNLATTRAYLDSFEDDTKKKMASLLVNF